MDLLNKDLTGVDTSFPVMQKCEMRFRIAEMKSEKSKDGKKDMIVTVFKSVYAGVSTKDEPIAPGFTITDRLIYTPSEKKTQASIEKDLALRQAAILGTQGGPFGPLEKYLNKEVDAFVDIEEDATGEYGPQNRLRKIKPAGAAK